MEAILRHSDNDLVEAYWKMLSSLSKTAKLKLAAMLTNSVVEEEQQTETTSRYRKAKVKRRATTVLPDSELEAKFANLPMPVVPDDAFTYKEIIKANSGKTIKPIEKWL